MRRKPQPKPDGRAQKTNRKKKTKKKQRKKKMVSYTVCCPICAEDMLDSSQQNTVKALKCGHVFCGNCIQKVIATTSG